MVSRYQAMPAPQGQTFFVVPGDGMAPTAASNSSAMRGLSRSSSRRAAIRRPIDPQKAHDARPARLRRRLRPDPLSSKTRSTAAAYGFGGFGYDPCFYRPRSAAARGFFDGLGRSVLVWRRRIDSYVEYHSQIDLHIRQAGTNQPLFDGRAQARSETNRLDVVVPSLVDAMFTGFPGHSGETIKITIPTRQAAS